VASVAPVVIQTERMASVGDRRAARRAGYGPATPPTSEIGRFDKFQDQVRLFLKAVPFSQRTMGTVSNARMIPSMG
jgi:hypothetical protein